MSSRQHLRRKLIVWVALAEFLRALWVREASTRCCSIIKPSVYVRRQQNQIDDSIRIHVLVGFWSHRIGHRIPLDADRSSILLDCQYNFGACFALVGGGCVWVLRWSLLGWWVGDMYILHNPQSTNTTPRANQQLCLYTSNVYVPLMMFVFQPCVIRHTASNLVCSDLTN